MGKLLKIEKTISGILILLIGLNISCETKHSTNACEWGKQMYREKWNYVVKKTYEHEDYSSTFVIETVDGKKIFFRPTQLIYSMAEPGDRLIKQSKSEIALLISKNGNDTLESRIFSKSCDEEIMKH